MTWRTSFKALLSAALLAAFLFLATGPGWGQQQSPIGSWYRGLMRPDTKTSCCDISDCGPVEARWRGNQWEALVGQKWGVDPPEWRPVPAEKVLHREHHPEGLAVLCALPVDKAKTVYCFVPVPQGF